MENILSNAQTDGKTVKAARNNIAVSAIPLNDNATSAPVGGVLENWGSNITQIVNDSNRWSNTWFEQQGTFEAAVLFPRKLFSQELNHSATNMALAIRKNMHFLKNAKVISPVIDVAIGNEHICNIDPPVQMVFKVPKNSFKRKRSWGCVFWDKRLNYYAGGWSYKGCNSILINSTHVRCFCNHLTSFAVVMRLNHGHKLTKVHQKLLSVITYVGCCLSILGLGIIILTFLLFKKWRVDVRHKVLFNFALALVSFLLIFIIGIEQTRWIYGCMAIAVLLHYFMLASFTWMLVEAFIQYLNLVKVIGTYIPNLIQKAMIFAWGIPFVIVVIILGVNTDFYFNEHKHCWLSDKGFYYGVAAPVILMLLINYVTFAVILYFNTCGRATKQLRSNQTERQELIIRAKAVFCASVLLGLSWVFGFLADIKGAELICEYIFAVTTTLQGFLLSIFFVFRRKNTRDLWISVVKKHFESEVNQKTSGVSRQL
ncbi:Adhesion G-protein coupled receptor G4 like protein [Argiope bruennichi]|uniref:Adhesion G-protein coupled receptor G4 like protein n=3 Tax=Argiope bruennichi TaxID=94029 RepID=A0A8T0E1D9_ARGBR|nr:Adhesion G-protein coupled receptor G4 like protein [Argiope bruennichi]